MMYQKWLTLGLEKGLSDIEIFATKDHTLKLTVYKQKVESHVVSDVENVRIRGVYDGKLASVSFEHVNDQTAEKMIDQLIENAKALTLSEPAIIYEGSKKYPEVEVNDFDFNQVPVKQKIDLLKTIETGILKSELAHNVQTTVYIENSNETTIVNSKGLNLSRKANYAYVYTIGVFKKDDDIKTQVSINIGKTFDVFDAQKMIEEVVTKGEKKVGGSSVPTKRYPTVFSNKVFSQMLGTFSSTFNGQAAIRNVTKLKDKVGEQVLGKNISIVDDPLSKQAPFQIPFDDEGVACYKRYVFKEGVFQGFLHNLKTAKMFNVEPTGHGFTHGISPTNIYVMPGEQSFDALIKPIEEGIYITDVSGLHAGANTISGDFSLQASGFKITKGLIAEPVRMVVVSGNFFDLLNHVKALGNDLDFDVSSIGSPSIYIESLPISGEA